MIILAVSDDRSQVLENMVSMSPRRLREIGMIVSCGDLDSGYVEFLADATHKPLQFVLGNHPGETPQSEPENLSKFQADKRKPQFLAGSENLHARLHVVGDYILLGFSGSIWYNGEGNQFTEEQMGALVGKAIRKLMWMRWKELVTRCKHRKVIVISHSPIRGIHDWNDNAHRGFECFRVLLERVQPLLWIHGHTHIYDQREKQMTVVDHTTVVNACGYKFIYIDGDAVEVSPHLRSS